MTDHKNKMDPLQHRRKRALFRASHRGIKEMDWLIGRYALAALGQMEGQELTDFEEFIERNDRELEAWIMHPEEDIDETFVPFITHIRQFHGLGS